jgi:hypothetical protein
MRFWLLPLLCIGCAAPVPSLRPGTAPRLASREDGVDIRVEMVSTTPSFEVTIDNRAAETVSFADAEITVEDETGRGYHASVAPSVRVIPGTVWHGALGSPDAPPQLQRGWLGVVMRGVRVGARELEPQAFVFDAAEPVAMLNCR